jgi:hypothetical protein
MVKSTTHTAFRLTDEDLAFVDALQAKMGITRTDVIRIAVRRLAEAERVKLSGPKKSKR